MTAPPEQSSARVPAPIVAAGTIAVLAGIGVLAYTVSGILRDGTVMGAAPIGAAGLLVAVACFLSALGLKQRRRGAQWAVVVLAALNVLAGFAAISGGGPAAVARIVAAALAGTLVLVPVSSREWFSQPTG